jgi:hypothetical protein
MAKAKSDQADAQTEKEHPPKAISRAQRCLKSQSRYQPRQATRKYRAKAQGQKSIGTAPEKNIMMKVDAQRAGQQTREKAEHADPARLAVIGHAGPRIGEGAHDDFEKPKDALDYITDESPAEKFEKTVSKKDNELKGALK